jgi:RHS repeat-associated protein
MGESYVETGATDRNFTGQNEDLTTGSSGDLYDFAYREYHPIHGRWISPDPAGLGAVNLANPQSWNRYAYTNGSPLNSVDPLGLTPTCVKQGTCVGESIVRDISGAGIYGSLTFAGSMLGVQTLTLSSTSTTSTGSAPSVIFDVPTYNNDGSWASLDRQETQWSTSSTTTDPWGASLSWVEMLGGGTPGSAQTTRTASAGTCPAGQTRMPNGNCDKPFPGGQELANGIAKGAGPAASPCFWVEWTALAASAGGGTAVWVNRAVAVDLAKDAAIKLAASQIGKAGLNPKPGVLTALGAGWNWFNNSCVP